MKKDQVIEKLKALTWTYDPRKNSVTATAPADMLRHHAQQFRDAVIFHYQMAAKVSFPKGGGIEISFTGPDAFRKLTEAGATLPPEAFAADTWRAEKLSALKTEIAHGLLADLKQRGLVSGADVAEPLQTALDAYASVMVDAEIDPHSMVNNRVRTRNDLINAIVHQKHGTDPAVVGAFFLGKEEPRSTMRMHIQQGVNIRNGLSFAG